MKIHMSEASECESWSRSPSSLWRWWGWRELAMTKAARGAQADTRVALTALEGMVMTRQELESDKTLEITMRLSIQSKTWFSEASSFGSGCLRSYGCWIPCTQTASDLIAPTKIGCTYMLYSLSRSKESNCCLFNYQAFWRIVKLMPFVHHEMHMVIASCQTTDGHSPC